jgi:hypothetical protein
LVPCCNVNRYWIAAVFASRVELGSERAGHDKLDRYLSIYSTHCALHVSSYQIVIILKVDVEASGAQAEPADPRNGEHSGSQDPFEF